MKQIEDEIDNKKKTFEFLKINKDDGATELEEYERFRRIFIIILDTLDSIFIERSATKTRLRGQQFLSRLV
jgi:hypothetical protein